MTGTASNLPAQTATGTAAKAWQPFTAFRREIERLMNEFDAGSWPSPFRRGVFDADPLWRRDFHFAAPTPAVDIVEKDNVFEIVAELPGLDEKNIDVKLANGVLTIKGEKHEDKEEQKKDYYLHERHFGSFERTFRVPEGVDTAKIDASFKKGVLTISLPKSPEAKQSAKKIEVKAA